MIDSDNEDLKFIKKGILVNVNEESFLEYKKRSKILETKDIEISLLRDKINIMEGQMALILKHLEGK